MPLTPTFTAAAKDASNVDPADWAETVNDAIAENPETSRDAMGLGTAATSNLSGLVLPGPYADNLDAIVAGDVAKDSIYRQPLGVLGWLNLTTEAAAYQAAHGISDAAALKISGFFEGLADIGISANFVDGCIARAASQPSGSSLVSLLGLSNLTLYGSPVREANAIYFDGVNDYALGAIAPTTGARTFVGVHCGLINDAVAGTAPIFRASNGTSPTSLGMISNGTSFGQAQSYLATLRTTAGNPGWSRNTPFANVAIRDDAAAGASSFSMRRAPHADGTTYTRTSTQGEASHTLNTLRIALYANNDISSIYDYIERLIPGWFLFSKSLSDTEENNLNTLMGQTIFPKWKMVTEGDSISGGSFIGSRMWGAGCWRAGNIAWINKSVGGEGAIDRAADLGTADGLNTTNLAVDMPAIVEVAAGSNDLNNYTSGTRPVSAIHAALRSMWAYVRSTNPAATLCASTIMPSSYQDDTGRGPDRDALNALIRADEGIYYDILFDKDAWIHQITATRPVYDDAAIFVQDGGGVAVHPTTTAGGGCDQLLAYMSAALVSAGVVP